MQRSEGQACRTGWGKILESGKFETDQESLDEAEKIGDCPRMKNLYSRHLLFAKDYIGWIFTGGHTFVHVTAAGRPDSQVS